MIPVLAQPRAIRPSAPPFDPAKFGTLIVDINPATLAGADGDFVSSINDGVRNWTASGDDRPQILTVDGTKTLHLQTDKLASASTFLPRTIAAVIKFDADDFLGGLIGIWGDFGLRLANHAGHMQEYQPTTSGYAEYDFQSGGTMSVNGTTPAGAYAAYPAATKHVLVATGNANSYSNTWLIGAYFAYGGAGARSLTNTKLFRLLCYSNTLDASNRAALAAALKKKYGVA